MSRTAAVRAAAPRTTAAGIPAARTTTARTTTARTGTARTATTRTGSPRTSPTRTPRATTRPELRLVPTTTAARPRRPRALLSRKASFVLFVVAMLSLTTVGLLVLNTAIAVDSLEASKLRAANAERAQEVQRLEQQVVAGSMPAEVARAAEAAGLVPAGVAGYLVLGPEATAMRGTPEPAPEPSPEPAAGVPGGN